MSRIQSLFNSYSEALSKCGSSYDSDDIAKVVSLKTKAFVETQNRPVIDPDPTAVISSVSCLAAWQARNRVCKIVDVGGASGYHYFCSKDMLGEAPHLWTVVETPAMARAAIPLFKENTIRFVSDLDVALQDEIDLIICSGALQYMDEPEVVFERICAAKPRHIVLARLPAYQGPRVVGLQQSQLSHNGPGPMPAGIQDRAIQYPVTFVPWNVLTSYLSEYRIAQRYASPSANYVIDQKHIPGITLVMERK